MENENQAHVQQAMVKRQLVKSTEMLLGMVTAMVADDHLHDKEIKLLSTWLSENQEVAQHWPGSVIAMRIQEVLSDGVITEVERAHLLTVLTDFSVNGFADTGSATAEVLQLPIDDDAPVAIVGRNVCHTGTFVFGTRSACERLTEKAGGVPQDGITRKTHVLVVGSLVSRDWVHTSFGRKIQKAAELQLDGVPISIISENRWTQMLSG
jgi:NAD-dependent DNA ligase